MKKLKKFFPILIIIVIMLTLLTACNDDETYNDVKEFRYTTQPTISVTYNTATNTSTVRVSLSITNTGSAIINKVTADCVFSDNAGTQLDRQSKTVTINLESNSIYYASGNFSMVFDSVSGNPTKVTILNAYGDFGLTEQEQYDAEQQKKKDWIANNWWIWIVLAYVVIGVVVGILCGYFVCADITMPDSDLMLSIACGLFWPIGGIILLVVYLQENGVLPERAPISIKFWYTIDGKKVLLKGKGYTYHEAYDQLSLNELQLICKEEGIANFVGLNKNETIDLIMEYTEETDEEETDGEDYTDLNVAELKEECKERGLSGYSSLRKDDLVSLLEDDDNNSSDTANNTSSVKSVKPSGNKDIPKTRMSDIAGLNEAKEAFNDRVILPIKHKELFEKYGKNVGGGILLYGLPGTGKTMFAQAVANELNATFFSIKCSDIMSKWYGESETKIKQLFANAKKASVAVIFFDEFEAIGRKRTASYGESGVSTVQEILAQMQGVEKHTNILLVLAATNCPWDIDSALLRPGRFNDKIYIPLPDFDARLFIIKKILSKVQLADDVSLSDLAESLDGYNSADVVEFCEQVKMVAIKREINKKDGVITAQDITTVKAKVHSSIIQSDVERMEDFRITN